MSHAPTINLVVNQISANSITVTWSGIPEDDDWNAAVTKASAASGRIAASVGGILASIKGTSNAPADHTSYSLYVTPISGAMQQNMPLQGDGNKPTLVVPFVSSSGSQKIELLDPDTLYRVSLTSDDTKRKSPPLSGKPADEAKPLFGWSSSILRQSKSTVDAKAAMLVEEDGVLAEKSIMASTLGTPRFNSFDTKNPDK